MYKMVFIYVLQLQEQKFYIGKTDNPQFRLDAHFNSNDLEWTKKYPPLGIVELIPNCDDYDEDKYTLKYIDKYGINNVRGCSFTEVDLTEHTIKILEKMSKITQENRCLTCGIVGYFAKKCKKCESLESIEKCFIFIETFIEKKKRLELVDPKFEKPKWTPENRGKFQWGWVNDELLNQEKERAKKQKEKNNEYLPLFEVICKTLQYLYQK